MPQANGRLPDFIIIGAMKSATSTLQEQLANQPGIFMSDPKEPNYFSDDNQFRRGMSWYASLFKGAEENVLLGEASTHYTKLPTYPETVKRLRDSLGNVKLIYVMRHPIDRLLSHYIHEWTMNVYTCGIDEAIEKYPEMICYGEYSKQLEPYFESFGREAILPVFFNRSINEPQNELERICAFIGYHGKAKWFYEQAPSNSSRERLRKFPGYDLIVGSYLATWLRRRFIPQSLRDQIKSKFHMQEKPVISAELMRELEQKFDLDLEKLGKWLGLSLNCSNFKEITTRKSLGWEDSSNAKS